MKKTLIHLLIAVILGVATTLVPLMAIAGTPNLDRVGLFLSDNEFLRTRQPQVYYDLASSKSPTSGLEVLIISFVIAMVVYLYAKHRMPSRPFIWVRFPPY